LGEGKKPLRRGGKKTFNAQEGKRELGSIIYLE